MKIISWNLLHSTGATLDEVEHLIDKEAPDLLLMQEATQQIDRLPARRGGHYGRHPLPGRLHGLAAWSPLPFNRAPSLVTLPRGLIVKRVCQIIELPAFTVGNVHLSHGQWLNRRQLNRVFDALPFRAAVLGDCNLIGPVDQSRFREAGPISPTHLAGTLLPLRLDRCFIRGLDCAERQILAKGRSDHHPIMVQLYPSSDPSCNPSCDPSCDLGARNG
jgi:endonuclease/exonuclease/phosphatase (EEP) superfamily protein YafD